MEHELLKLRTKMTDLNNVKIFCKHHTAQFDTKFFNNYRRRPAHLKSYRNVMKTILHEIALEKLE